MDELLKRERETARQRALRIPLAYHRTRGMLGWTKLGLSLLFFLGGGCYIAWVLGGGKRAAKQLSPGTLASAHARWESDCKACHVPFTPTRSDSFGATHHQSDAKCNACHKAAVHQENQIAHEVESCASCHREHQGKQALLVRTDDQNCTSCHSSIADHRTSAGVAPISDVSRFALGENGQPPPHPAFRSLETESDPGNIRFSHRLHMMPGQLYPGQPPHAGKELVQLKCESCHEPTPTAAGDGAYMQPIKYEQHCRSCHPLHVPGGGAAAIPHGLKAVQLKAAVVVSLAANDGGKSAAVPLPKRPIPGKTPRNDVADDLDPPKKLLTAQRLQEFRTNVCAKCHSWQQMVPAEVMPAAIPAVWLTHAKFSHKAHFAAAKCVDCHSQASEEFPSPVRPGGLADDERIMIPGIENCARCHSPRNETANSGGARFDCAQCHRYHNPAAKPTPQPTFASQVSNPKSQIPIPKSSVAASHTFVGAQSCSAAACHGAAKGNDFTVSYTRFVADDPHARAFLLLYTQPSLDMVRRLTSDARARMEDESYFKSLQQKCIGCHATPPADAGQALRPETYSAGVSCESCHGPAAEWEFTHFLHGPKPNRLPKLSDLSVRATGCAECHIGPKEMLGKIYDVNHDLIAAGHPRLTFEFEAQSANLPPHWSSAKDIKSHFDAWKTGELATVEQQDKLYSWRNKQHAREGLTIPDFASHRCFDCHHALRPPVQLTRIASEAPHKAMPPQSQAPADVRRLLARPAPPFESPKNFLAQQLDAVSNNPAAPGTRWEELVRFHLALTAFVADRPDDSGLIAANDKLGDLLANSFHASATERKMGKGDRFRGGPYDSPTGFDPNDPKLKAALDLILKNF
ncbi:MAG: cytochrome c3 family protein [Pirellulaceae bacterium]